MKPALQLVVGIFAVLVSVTAFAQGRDSCIALRIAVDVGSGSSKMRSGIVDVCRQSLLFEVAKGKKPIEFKKNLRNSGGKRFDPEFLVRATQEIKAVFTEVRERTVLNLTSNREYSKYKYLASDPIEVQGVCTQAFREAENASKFFDLMVSNAGGQPSIPIRLLSQIEEGRLGFMGAVSFLGELPREDTDPTRTISWDIGSASMQIVAYAGLTKNPKSPWLEFGNTLGSVPMSDFVIGQYLGLDPKITRFWNPVLNGPEQVTELLNVAESFVKERITSLIDSDWFAKRMSDPRPSRVYGIGGLHGGVLGLLRRLPGYEAANGYSQEDLRYLLSEGLFASETDLRNEHRWAVDQGFETGMVTNTLLVYSVMRALRIQTVRVLDADNSLGTLVSPGFWNLLDKPDSSIDPTER